SVGRYQQFICKICICVDNPGLRIDAGRYRQGFNSHGRRASWKTKCGESSRLFGSAREELGNSESCRKGEGNLARLEAEAGGRDGLSHAAVDWRGRAGERRGRHSTLRLSRNRGGFRYGGDL